MKKIVALALCLALALALCTVAFADTTINNYSVCTISGTVLSAATDCTVTIHSADADAKSVEYYTLDDGAQKYVKTTTPANGDVAVIARGDTNKVVLFYLTTVTNIEVAATEIDDAMDAVVSANAMLTKNTKECGKYYSPNFDATKTYYATLDENGDVLGFYVAAKAANANLSLYIDGKVVTVNAFNPNKQNHTFVGASFAEDGTVKTVKCSKCNAVWTFTKDYTVAKAAPDFMVYGNGYVYGVTAGTTAAAGVTSAKTFDAGVALYAGMALMSVAGSAVVIGKKKEF